jgi:hypothetical protein
MSRPKFLADHDLNEQIVVGVLRRAPTAEFRRVRELGFAARNDAFLLDYAAGQALIIVSHDVNTMPAAAYERVAAGRAVAGLIMVQQTCPVGPIIDQLVLIWSATEQEEWTNQVVFLPMS